MSIITTTEQLSSLCERLSNVDYITIDTEFIREKTYWAKPCLIQLGHNSKATAIDILTADLDLAPIFQLMRNKKIMKVFHAARQDLEIFYKLMGEIPTPIFDTQISAMVCGFGDSVSYENLILKLLNRPIDKASRFTDWERRPLSQRQIDYALADVTHLCEAYEKLLMQIELSGRRSWLKEEIDALIAPASYENNPYEAYKKIKSRNPDQKTMVVLRELAAWRENIAKQINVPRNRVIKDMTLLEIAHQRPLTIEELKYTRGLPPKSIHGDRGKEIISAIKFGLNLPKSKWPSLPKKTKLPRGVGPITDLLKVLLKMRCEDYGVASRLIASASDIELIAGYGETADVSAFKGWRREIFGNDAIRLLRAEIAIAAGKSKVRTVDLPKVTNNK